MYSIVARRKRNVKSLPQRYIDRYVRKEIQPVYINRSGNSQPCQVQKRYAWVVLGVAICVTERQIDIHTDQPNTEFLLSEFHHWYKQIRSHNSERHRLSWYLWNRMRMEKVVLVCEVFAYIPSTRSMIRSHTTELRDSEQSCMPLQGFKNADKGKIINLRD